MLTSNPRRIIASIWLITKVCDKSGNSPTTKPIFMLHSNAARRAMCRDCGAFAKLGVDRSPGPGGGALQDVEEHRELMLWIELGPPRMVEGGRRQAVEVIGVVP